MKIMTFNTQHCLNFVERKIDFEIMAKAITECDPDVVGLNEMRGQGTDPGYQDQMGELSRLTGMKYFYFAEAIKVKGENPYGNGILSRIPIVSAETVRIPDPKRDESYKRYESRCVLKATLENGVTVLIAHFGLHPDERRNAVSTVLEQLANEKCILMGDFNMNPDDGLLTPVRERMTDTAEMIDGEALTFPSDVPRSKIDYIFVSRDVKVTEADVPQIIASDHRPITVTVEI